MLHWLKNRQGDIRSHGGQPPLHRPGPWAGSWSCILQRYSQRPLGAWFGSPGHRSPLFLLGIGRFFNSTRIGIQPLPIRLTADIALFELRVIDTSSPRTVSTRSIRPGRSLSFRMIFFWSISMAPTSEARIKKPSSVTQYREGRRPLRSSTAPTTSRRVEQNRGQVRPRVPSLWRNTDRNPFCPEACIYHLPRARES